MRSGAVPLHPIGALLVAMTVVLGSALPALAQSAQSPAEIADALRTTDLYHEQDAEEVDEERVLEAVDEAERLGIDLEVVVLVEGGAENLAGDILDRLGAGTVVVFTAESYGVASEDVGQSRLDDALAEAADELSGPDAALGVEALVAALEPSAGRPWGWIIAGLVVVLVAVAVGGRWWDTKARAERQAARRERRRAELAAQAGELASQVVDLSDKVELADDPELSRRYRDAAASFREAEASVEAATGMHELDGVADRLAGLRAELSEIADAAG
jgi:hypothetical protein